MVILMKMKKKMKLWGKKYPICTIKNHIILFLNDRYKEMIEEYKKYEMNSGYYKEYVFQILLNNAIIYYHKGDLEKIIWKC